MQRTTKSSFQSLSFLCPAHSVHGLSVRSVQTSVCLVPPLSSPLCLSCQHGLRAGPQPHCGGSDHTNEEVPAVCGSAHRHQHT